MDFILKYDKKKPNSFTFSYCDSIDLINIESDIVYIEKKKHLDYFEISDNIKFQVACGDVIKTEESNNDLSKSKGLYYIISLNKISNKLEIFADDHSLLPIYYFFQDEQIYISSSFKAIIRLLGNKTVNQKFYPELALLYSPINGATYYKEVIRLGYGQVIVLKTGFQVITKERFFNHFTNNPKKYSESINLIADKFIETSKCYLNESCAISLTGGFDGRTITGCAHFHQTDFINFSYGRRSNGDIENPIAIAKILGLDYHLIELEDHYLENEYFNCVQSYIEFSGGLNGFQYPQSFYYVQEIKKHRDIIVTGYLGSEILASVQGGDDEVSPHTVLDFIKGIRNDDNYAFTQSSILQNLKIIGNTNDIRMVLDELSIYFKSLPKNLSLNQKFTVFAFENVYRNTFGTWIYNGMHYTKIRVPFLDRDFFNEICNTEVSQFYRKFLETNPIKRMKGQLLYSKILQKTWPRLNEIISSKGYAPADILTFNGRIKIAISKMMKSNKYFEQYGLNKLSTVSGAINYICNHEIDLAQKEMKKQFLIQNLNEDPIKRSLCFLSLSKMIFENIHNIADSNKL